jgi:glucose-1-phosphate cytidylyltransferase
MYKVLILAGGLGTRLSEETELKPKPMVEIGGQPILLHIMQIFAKQIEVEFIIATGYRSEVIEEYLQSSIFLATEIKARAVYTGDQTGTAGRVRKVLEMFPNEKFFITYGDGLANVNIKRLMDFHEKHGRIATVTAVRPAARYGRLHIQNGEVFHFAEKMQSDEGWINGGFFFVEPRLIKYLKSDSEMLEQAPLVAVTGDRELMAFEHFGFWQPMDTLREKNELDKLARTLNVPWMQID